MHKLSIVIPVFNESQTIEKVLRRIDSLAIAGWDKEIVVVDDGSTDGTRDIIRSLPIPMIIIFHERNGGKGTAVRTGLARATGDYVLIQDADLEYDSEEIPLLLVPVEQSVADVVFGSRNLRPRERAGAWIPRLGVWFLTKQINLLWGLHLTDVWTCYKLFPRAAAGDFKAGRFESELLFITALARRNYAFAEVPISYHPRDVQEGKKIRYRDGLWAIWVLVLDRLTHK
jgi:glycosyltransferase involved in cell wall biosynthesis